MAKFVKGHQGNSKGRGKGTPNITTREAREILNTILFSELENIKLSLANIRQKDDAKYLEILSKLLSYSLPKRTDLTSDDQPLKAGILGMTREQIEKELEQWKKV